MTSELIGIMKFNTLASLGSSVDVTQTLCFFRFPSKYRVKTIYNDFADIIHQNKQGFDGKKANRRPNGKEFIAFQQHVLASVIGKQDSKLFSYLDLPVCFACYPPKSFKIICLTCIWLKFVDTSFHSSQKKSQKHHTHRQKFSPTLKDRCVTLKLPGGWKLGPYLAKTINFLCAKFGGNRK